MRELLRKRWKPAGDPDRFSRTSLRAGVRPRTSWEVGGVMKTTFARLAASTVSCTVTGWGCTRRNAGEHNCPRTRQLWCGIALASALLLSAAMAFAGVTASISGTVKDASGA